MLGKLMTHCGAVRVARQELAAIAVPEGTATWRPIPHAELVTAIGEELERRNLTVRAEDYAVHRDGAVLFGVIDLAWRQTNEAAASIGLRTGNDRSMSLQIAVGLRIFVCDNMVFSGHMIALRRRHTGRLNLTKEIGRAMDRYQEGVLRLETDINRLRWERITDSQAKELICDVFRQRILPLAFFPAACDGFFSITVAADELRTRWMLHNCLTSQVHKLPVARAFEATTRLGRFFGLAHSN